jgi:hypothetical protein
MPRDGAIIFDDLIGKLDLLRIECAKCDRAGRYKLPLLVAQYGRHGTVLAFLAEIAADCPRRLARNDSDPCGAICPDLPSVV